MRTTSLSEDEARLVEEAAARVLVFGPDEDIARDGDQPNSCHFLLSGLACRYKLLAEGKRQITFQLPGDSCDLQALVLGRMDDNVGTLTRCSIAVVPHKDLLEIADRHPRVAALWADTLRDSAIVSEWLVNTGRRSAFARIAHLICEIMARFEVVDLARDGSCEWPPTQTELSDAFGLSTVHVNRVLQRLRGQGLITFRGNSLIIHDWARLVDAGDFEPAYLHLSRRWPPAQAAD